MGLSIYGKVISSMSKYCPKCRQNFSDGFDECVYCGISLVEGTVEIMDDTVEQKEIPEMSDCELLEKYADYRTSIERQVGNISDKDFLRGLREGYRDNLLHQSLMYENKQPEYIPKCPTCGSCDVEKISFTKKAMSGVLFGVFSSNIRNTMYCKNCGAKW